MIVSLSKWLGLNISQENFQIRAEQMRALLREYPSMIVANVVMAPLVAWLMWHKIDHGLLLSWVALLYVFHTLEIYHWLNYPKEILSIEECKRWQRQFLLSDSLVGALWGSAGVFMFIPGEPVFQAFMLCIMMGMAAGAVAGNLVFPLSQQSYVALVMLPILSNMMLQGTREYYLLATMAGVFLIFVLKVGRDQSKFFERSISHGFENENLVKELQQSEERYRTFAEKLPLGITVLQDGLIKYVNHAITVLLGYTVEEMRDKPFLSLIHEDDRPWALDLHRRRMQGEDVPRVFVVRMIRKDGVVRQWEMHASTTEWEGKRSSLAIVADITERVAMEEALRNSFRQLEEKELAKTRFLAAAGHDLRQPVAAANLFVDALKNTAPSPRQSELIARLDQSMGVFSELLERLLDISKLDAGLIKPQLVSFNLIEMLNWLEQNFADTARGRQLDFRIFFTMRQPLVVRTDIGLLQSVMMNLVSNAIKFTERGGILISARVRGDRVLLQVRDTGRGIAEADMPHIFDEFYQAGNPQRNRDAGLGLGLSICRRAMTLLGADIVCHSRLGRGSVLAFSLPLLGGQHEVTHLLANQESPQRVNEAVVQGKRVVVLEDDALVAHGLVNLLQGLGAEVSHFHNAEDALQHQGIGTADFFVVDYALGGKLSGIEFVQTLQAGSTRPIHAVVVTGETSSQFIEDISGLVWPVLHKPVNYAKLAASLNSFN